MNDNLKKWMGQSAVVASDSSPRVVFHGTVIQGTSIAPFGQLPKGAFTVFDKKRCGSVSDASDAREGFWFTASRARADDAAADAFATEEDDCTSPFVFEVYLRMENPVALANVRDYTPEEVGKIARRAKRDGHDGLLFLQGEYGEPDYLVFSAGQIKSAVANCGAYSGDDHDITDAAAALRTAMKPTKDAHQTATLPNILAFEGFTQSQFLGNPTITTNANARDLKPSILRSLVGAPRVPFIVSDPALAKHGSPSLQAVYGSSGAAVFDGEKVIASYHFGDTLVVDKQFRRRGIGAELAYQFRTRFPETMPAKSRTKASQALQIKVWERICRELVQVKLAQQARRSAQDASSVARSSKLSARSRAKLPRK